MDTTRALVLCGVLALAAGTASAAETPGTLTCGRCGCKSRYKSCYDPCEPVGPIRRFFRRVFRTPCPPVVAAPVMAAPVYPPAPACPTAPVGAPAPFAGAPAPPPDVELGRPGPGAPSSDTPPPPSPPAPFTGRSRLLPASPAPSALRFDRVASRTPDLKPTYVARAAPPAPDKVRVILVSVSRAGVRQQFQATSRGGLTANLAAGDWLVYTQAGEGKLTFKGRVSAREGQPTRIDLSR